MAYSTTLYRTVLRSIRPELMVRPVLPTGPVVLESGNKCPLWRQVSWRGFFQCFSAERTVLLSCHQTHHCLPHTLTNAVSSSLHYSLTQ